MTNLKDYDIINTQDKTTTVFKTRKVITMAMKMAEIQKAVKENAFAEIKSLFAKNGEQFGDFEIAVPVNIDGSRAQAKYADGILCISIPRIKSENGKTRQIEIQ